MNPLLQRAKDEVAKKYYAPGLNLKYMDWLEFEGSRNTSFDKLTQAWEEVAELYAKYRIEEEEKKIKDYFSEWGTYDGKDFIEVKTAVLKLLNS